MSGTGAIWYMIDDHAPVKKITGLEWSDITEPRLDVLESVSESISGRQSRVVYRRRYSFTITAEGLTNAANYRDLRALCDHLERGGSIALAIEEAKAFVGTLAVFQPQGDTSIGFWLHPLATTWALPDAVLVSGDLVWVGTPSPDRKSDLRTVSSFNPSGTIITSASIAAYKEGSLVRSEGFWPLVRLDLASQSGPLMPTIHRIAWGLELALVEDLTWETMALPGDDGADKYRLAGGL